MSETGFRLHKEKNFENAIASDLAASGWRRSENDEGYDRARALYPADVFDWLKTAYPKEFAQLQKLSSWEVMLLDRLQEVARQHGALALLRDPHWDRRSWPIQDERERTRRRAKSRSIWCFSSTASL